MIQWPWVSRELYESVRQSRDNWKQLHEMLHPLLAVKDERYDLLLDKYTEALRPKQPDPITRQEPDAITKAITEVAGSNGKLRSLMGRQAIQDKLMGMRDDEIISHIYAGINDDDGVPSA